MSRRLFTTGIAVAAALLLCLLCTSELCVAAKQDLEGFDEEPVLVKPASKAKPKVEESISSGPADTKSATVESDDDQSKTAPPSDSKPQQQQGHQQASGTAQKDKYIVEGVALVVLVFYLLNIFSGRQSNQRIADAWTKAFALPGGLFDRNFAYIGPSSKADGTVELMKESGNIFKLYASGRRYCQGLLATLQLRARQDMLTLLWNLVSPDEDTLELSVYMAEASMPPIVLAVGAPKAVRVLAREHRDVEKLTKRINIARDQLPTWPNDRLHVMAEHSSLFYDLFSDPKVQQLFNPAGPHGPAVLKYLRSMHFTSENSAGAHKRVLRFVFALPPPGDMEAIAKLMELVPLFIDLVGTYKLTPELKKRALDARAAVEESAEEEARKKRLEALQNKKMEKAQEEKMRLARMTPEARQKYEEKMQRAQMKKAMNKKTIRL